MESKEKPTQSGEMKSKQTHWNLRGKVPFGFVYQITNIRNNRKYIGKKQCITNKKYPPLKGKTRCRRIEKETNWRNYTGSCKELNRDIELFGKENFRFEVLRKCESRWELAYEEARLQFKHEVLFDDEYYNGIIHVRLGKKR